MDCGGEGVREDSLGDVVEEPRGDVVEEPCGDVVEEEDIKL